MVAKTNGLSSSGNGTVLEKAWTVFSNKLAENQQKEDKAGRAIRIRNSKRYPKQQLLEKFVKHDVIKSVQNNYHERHKETDIVGLAELLQYGKNRFILAIWQAAQGEPEVDDLFEKYGGRSISPHYQHLDPKTVYYLVTWKNGEWNFENKTKEELEAINPNDRIFVKGAYVKGDVYNRDVVQTVGEVNLDKKK